MASCLVQQLFRQKIGKDLDQNIIDEVLFPLLMSRKHPPKELLQDIKVTQTFNENGHSAIVQIFYGGTIKNSSLFGCAPIGFETPSPYILAAKRLRYGKNTSRFRRQTSYHTSWGSVDILNELRESKTRYTVPHRRGPGLPGAQMSICLEEEPLSTSDRLRRVMEPCLDPSLTNELLNEFIEQSLLPGKRLSWGGGSRPTLCTYPK